MSDKQTANVSCVGCEGEDGGERQAWWRQPKIIALYVSGASLIVIANGLGH